MWALHNAKERDFDDWRALLEGADPNLEIVGVTKTGNSRLSMIEATLKPRKA